MPVLIEELAQLKKKSSTRDGHRWQISSLVFNPDGSLLASGSWDKEVRIWDLNTLETKTILKGVHKVPVTSLSWESTQSSKLLAVGSADCTASLWNTSTGRQVGTLQSHNGWVLGVSFGLGSSLLATSSWDGSIRIWDSQTMKLVNTLKGHEKGVWCVDFKPVKESPLLCSGSEDGTVRLWDTRSNGTVRIFEGGHSGPVYSVSWSTDSAMVATGSEDTKICIWEPGSGSVINTINSHTSTVKSLCFNPQTVNMSLPVLSSAGGYTVNISDPRPGYKSSILSPIYPHEPGKEVESVRISPDGSLLASGGRDGNIVLMTLMVPRLLPSFRGRGRIMDYKQKARKSRDGSTFIKDISHREDEDEIAVEELDELDDILSSPLKKEVEQNVARLKRLGRTAAKEMELVEHSTVKKTATAKSSRKKRVTGKNIDLPTMIAHLASDKTGITEAEEEEDQVIKKREEEETKKDKNKTKTETEEKIEELEELEEDEIEDEIEDENDLEESSPLPRPLVTANKALFYDSSEETDDLESQFLDGMSDTQSSVHSTSFQKSLSMDGHYSMLDHLDSSILITAGAKKSKKKQIAVEMHQDIPEVTSMSNVSIGTGSYMNGDAESEAHLNESEENEEEELLSVI
ncbi:PREDICTED: uncharacterized protein LOC109580931 [Amphimedon queenslandica]|uniref:Anaphase-promoting complex subunit 4 WD40 domain-containing protein n=1 Tax=Amphimedon queenslandica TaxID=400682 RepID=A0AAN0J049_AMPQE|nr:PREDICTED: uncharacterized protein LOC109580931 [Amphimedon queenslandica]|eukprot:XP_019850088.1 PREDICTED: uncharacterized protein LOC109580931 [Amphimedon queenslandica]